MKNSGKNIILLLALSATAIMCVGLFVYEFVPSGLAVPKASEYTTETATTEVLSDAKEANELLTSQNMSTSSTGGSKPVVKTNIVLKEYDVSKTDLALYKASNSYVPGRSDPFAEVSAQESESSGDGSSTATTTTTPSDGTFYNSTRVK